MYMLVATVCICLWQCKYLTLLTPAYELYFNLCAANLYFAANSVHLNLCNTAINILIPPQPLNYYLYAYLACHSCIFSNS